MLIVKFNDRGPDVRKLQFLLNSALKPIPSLKIDGNFGARTQQVVMEFQRKRVNC
jgi:peptidoglycan hydrolase-like protein with peptidoglycan-binding domain